jgi:threonine dehydrogenase-like Zn-dependent dehydrogenase
MATAGARLLGAGLIIAVETRAVRQQLARRFGADHIVDFATGDAVAEIMQLTGGAGVDAAIEALGAQASFEACVRVTRPGGTIASVGYYGQGDFINIPRLAWGVGMADKTIRTSLCPGGRVRLARLLRLLEAGRVDPTPMTTHRVPFEQLGHAFDLMRTKQDNIIKPLILFE